MKDWRKTTFLWGKVQDPKSGEWIVSETGPDGKTAKYLGVKTAEEADQLIAERMKMVAAMAEEATRITISKDPILDLMTRGYALIAHEQE